MTGTASGRALGALKAIGMDETPVGVLEREDALFVLTPHTLVYQDGGGTRRVTLRDLTRIHSDEQGVLRVETPAGTALTATLLGFDVAQVQAFFAQVRDITARAKEQPASPLPTPGGLKTFGSAPEAAPGTPAPQLPETQTSQPQTPEPSAAPQPTPPPIPAPTRPAPSGTGEALASPSSAPTPRTLAPEPRPGGLPGTSRPVAEAPSVRPVVISSSAFTPSAARTPTLTTEAVRPPDRPALATPGAGSPAADRPTGVSPAPVSAAPVSATPANASAPSPAQAAPPSALARQADVVDALTGRLRFLGGVLFVAALALAAVQYTSGARLDGLWTLLSGGVGTIALLALAELARLLVLNVRAGRPTDLSDDA